MSRSWTRLGSRLGTAFVASTLLLGAPRLALAEAPPGPSERVLDEARTRFARGVQLYHEGNFPAALAEFGRAYQLAPSYRLLYNLAQVNIELHDHAEALRCLRQYLAEGEANIPADRRAQVAAEILKLEARVGYLEIATDVEGAEILIDDVRAGFSPLRAPVMVNSGVRRVSASKTGHAPAVRRVTIAGGDRRKMQLELPELAAAPVAALVVPSASSGAAAGADAAGGSHTRAWIALLATGALAAGAGTFALLSLDAKKEFEDELGRYPTSQERIDRSRSHLVKYAAITDALMAASVVGAGVTIYFALSGGSASPEARVARTHGITVTPALAGLSVSGGF
jgi:tetratricopeptide (TPR) repeat protein